MISLILAVQRATPDIPPHIYKGSTRPYTLYYDKKGNLGASRGQGTSGQSQKEAPENWVENYRVSARAFEFVYPPWFGESKMWTYVPWSKVAIFGDGHPTFNRRQLEVEDKGEQNQIL